MHTATHARVAHYYAHDTRDLSDATRLSASTLALSPFTAHDALQPFAARVLRRTWLLAAQDHLPAVFASPRRLAHSA